VKFFARREGREFQVRHEQHIDNFVAIPFPGDDSHLLLPATALRGCMLGGRPLFGDLAARAVAWQVLHQPAVRAAAHAVPERPAEFVVRGLTAGLARTKRAAGRARDLDAVDLLLPEHLAVPPADQQRHHLDHDGTGPAELRAAAQEAGEQVGSDDACDRGDAADAPGAHAGPGGAGAGARQRRQFVHSGRLLHCGPLDQHARRHGDAPLLAAVQCGHVRHVRHHVLRHLLAYISCSGTGV